MIFTANQRVGEIVAAFPDAANLFKAHGVDFCCGGGRPLADALAQKAIQPEPFVAQLNQAYATALQRAEAGQIDWRHVAYSALIGQIVGMHHDYLRQELPVLSSFVTKIAKVHGDRHPELVTLHDQFHTLKAELESHLQDEEERLFPLVRAYERSRSPEDLAKALATLDELESEHEAAGDLLKAMRQVTGEYTVPADGCRTYEIAYRKLEALESDMFTHVHLENNILFERLRGELR